MEENQMKKSLVIILLISVTASFAADLGLYQVGPTLGFIMPEDPYDMGFQIGAKANIGSVMDGKIGLFPVVNYWRTSAEDFDDYTLSNIKIGIDAHYDLSEYVENLYAGAGLAMNVVGFSYTYPHATWNGNELVYEDKEISDSDNELGISLLVGYNLEVSGKPTFLEGKYDMIDNLNTIGVKAGVYFDMK